MDNFISYNNPRICSAAKLAMRGVQISGVPYDMSEMSEFMQRTTVTTGSFTWDGTSGLGSMDAKGFAPIVVYNPSGIGLQYLVTIEWRVRFDPSNPAQASHVTHPTTSDSFFTKCVHGMMALGNGAEDIVESVASLGRSAYRGMQVVNGIKALGNAHTAPLMLTG